MGIDTRGSEWRGDGYVYFRTAAARGLAYFENGKSLVPPQADDILVFDRSTTDFRDAAQHGHVAIVTSVGPLDVSLIEQNFSPCGDAKVTLQKTSGGSWFIPPRGGFPVLGWLRPRSSDVVSPQVSVSPASVPQEGVFTQAAAGLTANGYATLYFRSPNGKIATASVRADSTGSYSQTYQTSSSDQLGLYLFWAVDNTTQRKSDPVQFSITQPVIIPRRVAVTPTAIERGGIVNASWSGFGDTVNVEVWKGNAKWVDASTTGPKSGSQALVTTDWEVRSDYVVRVVQKTSSSIAAYSRTFAVTDSIPTTVFVTTSPSSVTLVDISSGAIVGDSVVVGNAPFGVAVTPNGRTAYVANACGGAAAGECSIPTTPSSISVIDTVTAAIDPINAVRVTIPLGRDIEGIAISPDGGEAYAVARYGPASVFVIDTASNAVIGTVRLPNGASENEPVFSPDGTHAYITTSLGVDVVDTGSMSVVSSVPVGDQINGGVFPAAEAVRADGAIAFVSTYFGDNGYPGIGTVKTIDAVKAVSDPTHAIIGSVDVGYFASGLALTRDGKKLYVAHQGGVSILNTDLGQVERSIPIAGGGFRIALAERSNRAYVAQFPGTTVSVIDTSIDSVIATLEMGGPTLGVALGALPQ